MLLRIEVDNKFNACIETDGDAIDVIGVLAMATVDILAGLKGGLPDAQQETIREVYIDFLKMELMNKFKE